MAGPWEKYQQQAPAPAAPAAGPWQKYANGVAPAAAPAAPEEPSLVDRIMGVAEPIGSAISYAGQELARGVTQMAGAPVDLINASPMLGNLLPGEQGFDPISEDPVLGSEQIWDLVTAPRDAVQGAAGLPVGDRAPQNMPERVIGRAMNEVGAAAVPVAGAIGAGSRMGVEGARAMQQSARPIARGMGRFVESAAVDPAKFAIKEGTYAAGAGMGAGVARELASDDDFTTTSPTEEMADILGAVFGYGGVAGTHYAGRGVNDMARAAFDRDNFATSQARTEAAADIGRAAGAPEVPSGAINTQPVAEQIARSPRVGDTVPGFQDTTADVLQNPGVASLEFGRQNGAGAGVFNTRRQANQVAANDALTDAAPTGTPGAYSAEARRRRDDLMAQLNEQLAEVEGAVADQAERLRPGMPVEARGQAIRGGLDDALGTAREIERDAWSQVQGRADPAPLADAFDSITEGLTQAEQRVLGDVRGALRTPRSLADGVPPAGVDQPVLGPDGQPLLRGGHSPSMDARGAPVRLEEITSLRSELTSAVRQAEAAGDPNKARLLNRYVSAMDSYLDTAPDIAGPLREARAVSRDLNDRFTRNDAIGQTLQRDSRGGPRVPDSDVARRFVQPDRGDAQAVDRLLAESDTGAVREALEDQLRAEGERLLDSPDRLERFIVERSRVFDKFPDLRTEYGTAAGLRRNLKAQTKAVEDTGKQFSSTSGNAVGRYLQYGDERAVDAMRTVIKAKDPAAAADELLSFVDDTPQAVEGARAAFWEALKSKSQSTGVSTRTGNGGQQWRFQSLANFVEDPANAAVMERLYRDDPQHLEHIRMLADGLSRANFGQTGRAAGSSGTPQGILSAAMPSAESVGSRVFAVNRGVVSPQFAAFNLGSVMARKIARGTYAEQYGRILDQALLDPDVAEMLTREYNPANVAALARWAKGAGFALADDFADVLLETDEGEGEDDEMMEAISR